MNRPAVTFGFDVLDTLDQGFGAWGYDTLDVLREEGIPMRCTKCGQWLYGEEALAHEWCWRCRNGMTTEVVND